MDLSKLTQSCQQALQEGQAEATRRIHQAMDVEHFAWSLIKLEDGLFRRMLELLGVSAEQVEDALQNEIDRLPRVSGPGASPAQVYLTQSMSHLLTAADDERKAMKDEYVSVEHFLIAMVKESGKSPTARA